MLEIVFPRWAARAVLDNNTLVQFGLAGHWNSFLKGRESQFRDGATLVSFS